MVSSFKHVFFVSPLYTWENDPISPIFFHTGWRHQLVPFCIPVLPCFAFTRFILPRKWSTGSCRSWRRSFRVKSASYNAPVLLAAFLRNVWRMASWWGWGPENDIWNDQLGSWYQVDNVCCCEECCGMKMKERRMNWRRWWWWWRIDCDDRDGCWLFSWWFHVFYFHT